MSATNRGAVRRLDDFYETPAWLTLAILPYVLRPRQGARVLEPASGDNAIASVIRSQYPGVEVVTRDLRYGQDFLASDGISPSFDLIITNPPYSVAEEFCQQAMNWRRNDRSVVAMLLRLNFLGSQERARWLRENTPSVYVSPKRPSFTGTGTDATEYAWFVWDGNRPPTVRILETEQTEMPL